MGIDGSAVAAASPGGEIGDAAAQLIAWFTAASLAMARPLGAAVVLPVFTRAQLGGPVRGCFALALSLPAVPGVARLLREAGRTLSLRLGYHGQALTAGAAAPKRGRRPRTAPESA